MKQLRVGIKPPKHNPKDASARSRSDPGLLFRFTNLGTEEVMQGKGKTWRDGDIDRRALVFESSNGKRALVSAETIAQVRPPSVAEAIRDWIEDQLDGVEG
jgi:hypothetical protein